MKLTSKEALDLLNENIGKTSSDKWIKHSKNVGYVAGVIASNINLDSNFAKTLGYIHDIGKKYGLNSDDGVIPHAINGYNYIKSLGYDEDYASICIKHSFLNNDINCLANDRDYTDSSNQNYQFIKEYIKKEYTIYEKIINLCDLMCTDKIYTVDKRMMDLLLRHGVYKNTHYHIKETYKLKEYLDSSRPTAVNLSWATQRIIAAYESGKDLIQEAIDIHNEDIEMCRKISEYGLSLLNDGDGVLTHCNAGELATSKYGTGLGPLILGKEKGYNFKVYSDETRPLLQGARLTSYELEKAGIDVTVICDNMAGYERRAYKRNIGRL